MPQYQISVPGQGTFLVESPTELTDAQAWQAVQSQLSAAPQKSTITGELVRGGKQLASSIRTGLESLVSPEQAAIAGVERGQKISEEAGEGPSFAAVRKAYEEKGILPAAGEVISQIPRALAGQGAQLAAMAGGARLGAMAGSAVLPGAGTVIGGVLGAGATLLPQFMGANVERQAQEQLERNEPVSIDRTKAYGAAAGQAALEATGTAFVLGKRLVKGVLGIADDAALATAKAQQELAKAAARSVAASAGRGALRGTAEIPVEIAQAVLERAQAGLDLTSPEALSEYGENAYLAGLIGPTIGGVSGVAERSGARAKQRELAAPKPVAPEVPAPAVAGALEYKPEPFIQFPDGTVAKRSEVEAYIKTLPEDQQMQMRAKLLGLAPQEAEKEPAPPAKALEYKPEPLIVYPDGSVAKRSEVEAYIQGLPEDEQVPARAKLLGMGEEVTQVTPEMLRKLGIRGRAPIIQRLSGLELTDPKVREELTNFSEQPFASPEVRGNIFGFLNAIKVTPATPVSQPPVSEAPPAEPVAPTVTPHAPSVEPVAEAVEPPAPPVAPPAEPPAPPVEPAPVVEAAAPAEETPAEPLGTRKEAQAFGKAIGATQSYPGSLIGRVNQPAQKAAKEGNFQGVLSALEKSKNVIVSEIAKRAKSLGTKIVIDDNAEETYTGPSTLMRQMSIDGAKMHLEALNKIREFAPQVDALPDKAELSYAIRGATINAIDGGEPAGRMGLEDIAKMGHSMFAPLPIGEGKLRTKEDFKRLQKAYEDLTSEYGENALQLTSTGSAQMTGVAGAYDADTDTIRVPEYNSRREDVLAHEIVHAQTVQAIANPSLRQKPIVARLNKLYEHVKKELEVRPGFSNSLRRAPYGIQSIQEFVAEGMGNPAFQFLLTKIKYENTSAWDSFVQTIANLIGVKRDTAFTELLSIYSDLTTEQKAAPKAEAPAVEAPAPAAEAPAKPAKAAPARKQPNTVMGSTMLADISNRLGGLDLSLLSEFSTKFITKRKDKNGRPMTMWRNPMIKGVGTLFRKGGESDYVLIATMLEEAGYLEPGSVERDYKEAGERAKELIKAALNREEVLTIEQQEKQALEDEEANRQAWLEQQEELKAERDKAAREAGLTPYEGDLLTDDDIDLFAPTGPQTDEQYAAGMRGLGFDETEIADAVQKKQERERAQKTAPGRPAEARTVPETGEGTEGLTRYTPEEVTRKQEEAEQATAAEKKAKAAEQERLRKEQQAKEEKARADESVKDFELGKSAEEQMTGMGDLFLSVEPTVKSDRLPSLKRGVDNLVKIYEKGWMSTDEFATRVNILVNQIETAELAKERASRKRGPDFLRQRLLEAKRRGELSEEAVDFAEWFILQNPKLVDDLGISIRTPKEDGVGGMYSAYNRVMYLMKNRGSETTVVHEILHHLERMMPKEVQSAIRKTWIESLMEAQRNAKTDADKKFFNDLTEFHFKNGRPVLLQEAIFAIKEGNVSKDLYQYTSPSEFWAENASEIMKGRFDVKGSVLGRLKQWLSELKEKARSLFGLENKAAIIRALDSLSKGDGKFVSKNLLDDSKETKQVIKEVRKSGEDRATANFLRWFGDSKVVDENGEPLVVYHGSKSDITKFDPSKGAAGNQGMFFTTDIDLANVYGKDGAVYPVYVSIKNPLILQGNERFAPQGIKGKLAKLLFPTQYKKAEREQQIKDMLFDGNAGRIFSKQDVELLRREGYDGVVTMNAYPAGSNLQVIVAFEPTQIKSAIGNNGDYSLTNPDIRKSIGGVTPGQKALETIRAMGMDVKPPEPGFFKRTWNAINGAGENPSLSKEELKKTLTKFTDKIETSVFSTDAAFNNDLTRSVIKDINQQPEVLAMLLQASQSQTVNIDNVTSRALMIGSARHNKDMQKWEAVGTDEDGKKLTNFKDLGAKLEEIAKKYNISVEEAEQIGHTYLIAKRLPGIIRRNAELDAKITAEKATAKPDRKQIEEWDALKVYVSPTQEAMIEPGLSLVKTMPELSEIVDIQQGIRKNIVKPAVESGLWSQEYADAMLDNVDWVPFYRDEQLDAGGGPLQVIRGLQVKSKEFRLKGSDAAVANVFDNQFLWAQYLLSRAMRAQKARAMVDLAAKTKINGEPMAVKVTEEKRGMNIVRVFRDGKQELWDMKDPMYVDAFVGIQNVANSMFPWAAKLAEILRNSVILYPLFSVAQVPQDAFAAMFTSGLKPQYALRIPFLAVKEFIKTLNKTSATHNALINFGVVGARTFNADAMRNDAEIYAGVRPPKGGWAKIKDNLEHISMAGDNAVRQAVYEAAQQQGVSKPEAIEKAFEIFNVRRRGTNKLINLAGSTIPFFYAYLAAQRVAYRTITGAGTSPTQRKAALETLAYTSASVFALSMLYAMMVADDEDYQEMPTAVRDRTLTIPGTGGVRIPLRPDFFLFPKIVAEHTYLMITDQGYQDGAKFRKAMLDGLANAVSSPTPLPQIVKPSLEVLINYSFFDSKPIVGTFEKQKETARQFNDSTSEFAKLIGSTGVMSPLNIDYLVRGYFGSFGGLGLFMTNFLNSDPDVPRPELSWKEAAAALPGTSGFLKRPQESALKNDFYTLRDEVEKAVNTFNDIKTRSPQGMEDFLADEKKMARYMLGKPVDQINRQLSKIRRQMTIITNMPESQMSAEDKAENIRQLREFEREYLKSVDVKALREMAKI